MCRKLIYVMTFVFALSSTAHAGLYVWNGSAGDGLWETALNWTVTDSVWTWPNEENAADPNLAAYVNSDVLGIDIIDGGVVDRADTLRIKGPDELTTAVLTLNNVSSLTVNGRLSIGTAPDDMPVSGQLDILGGSTLTILDGPNGNDLYLADDTDTVGTVNIIDSTVDIFDDLIVDQGEGYINISGSSIVTVDDLTIANTETGVGTLDISGTAAFTTVDDFRAGHKGKGTVNISGDATLDIPDELEIANNAGSEGEMNISGNAAVNIGDDLNVGDDGPGICNISENAAVTVADDIYVGHNSADGVFESHMTISGNASVTSTDLIVANNGGLTGYLQISGNPTIHATGKFYMNDDEGDPAYSQVIMDGGTVTVDGYTTFNDDNPGTAEFIMNGGSFYSADYLNISDNLDGTVHLTMNGGEMITGDRLRLGKDGGEDTGQVRIFMNGGVLQAEELDDIMITDTQMIYTGGEFRINSASVSEADMQGAIDMGLIVAEGVYSIVTDGAYTVLNPKAKTIAKVPRPVDGAEGVSTRPMLSWVAGETAASHDVYIGQSFEDVNAGAESTFQGNTEVASFVPELVVRKTYYWRVDEVEADGATVHIGDVWSFTVAENITVDDFEHYNDVDNLVFDAWVAAGGATVGNVEAPYMVPHFVNADIQAMPLFFDNTPVVPDDPNAEPLAPVSEATLTLDPAQNWATGVDGVEALTLSFRGRLPDMDPGSTSYDEETGVITMVGRGADIWGSSDEFQYAYLPLSGDGLMIVRIEDLAETDNWSKAGIMIRETLDAGSKHASVYVTTPANGIRFQSRPETDASSTADDAVATDEAKAQTEPVWLKLERIGDEFNAYYALPLPEPEPVDPNDPNAVPVDPNEPEPELEWIAMGWNPQVLPMDPNVFIGLALTSHSGAETYATATLSNLEFEGGVGGLPLTSTEIGLTTTQSPATLYAAIEDSAGGISVAKHPDPDAMINNEWVNWTIDLSEFDIDISDVAGLTIGVEPAACDDPFVCSVFDDTGKVDIDDVLLIPDVAMYDGTLDGWDHDNSIDMWDGSAPGEGNPGGLAALTEDDVTFLRLQDTGDPRDYGSTIPTLKTNFSLYLTQPTDFALDGAIIEFRARIATTGTLDAWRKDGGGMASTGLFDWPAGGLGGSFDNYGRGNIGIAEKGQGVISFSLSTSGLMVGKSGNKVSVDDATQWNTFKVEISAGGSGTHVVKVSANGGEAKTFDVTAGSGVVGSGKYITVGSPDLAGRVATAFDVDYIKLSW